MKLTDKQIENWRNLLCGQLGPYAFIMSPEAIEAYAEHLQQLTNEEATRLHEEDNDKTED